MKDKPGTALTHAPRLTPAWEPDPPGPLSTDPVPDRYLIPPAPYSSRPELVIGIAVGTAAATPFLLFAAPLWGFVASLALIFGGTRLYAARRLSRWRRELEDAFASLDSGDFDAAEDAFRRIALRQSHPALRSASADFGYLALRRGDYQTALAIYSRTWRTQGLPPALRANVCGNIAFCYAAMGELDAAARWLPDPATLVMPGGAAVIRCRQGRFADALELSMPSLEPWQRPFLRHEQRLLYLMHAFALDRLGETDDVVGAHLQVARPAFAGEFDYLTANWPELTEFLCDRGR